MNKHGMTERMPALPGDWLAFTGNVIDPLSEKRSDNSIQVALDDPRTKLLLIGGGKVCIKVGGNLPTALFHLSEVIDLGLDLEDAVLLGDAPSGPVVAVPFRVGEISATQDMEVVDLRSTYQNGLLSDDIVGALAQGSALLSWHQAHRFCGRCGAENEVRAGGYKRTCPACGTEHFPRTDPVAIMLIAKGDQCLLGRSFHFAPGMYSCLSGFIEPGETIEAAVRRETFEESGIRIGDVRYVSSQPWPFPYSLMIGCIAEALTEEIAADTTELEDCRWFSRTEVRQMLDGTHPHRLRAATKGAIARQLIVRWADST